MTARTRVVLWTDYVSPYAFVAKAWAYQLEADYEIDLEWRPYTLDIASFQGSVEQRDPHHWRRVRYAYMDARRFANKQGLVLMGPKKIYYARTINAGMLYAQQHGVFRAYNDLAFDRFWRRDLDPESVEAVSARARTRLARLRALPPSSTAKAAPGMTRSAPRPRHRAFSASRVSSSMARFSGAAIESFSCGKDSTKKAFRAAARVFLLPPSEGEVPRHTGRWGHGASQSLRPLRRRKTSTPPHLNGEVILFCSQRLSGSGLGLRAIQRAVDPLVEVLHVAALPAGALLDLPLGATERVVHREGGIGEPFVVV